MRLYAGMSEEFQRDTLRNQIAGKLTEAFFAHFRYRPPQSEVRSWQNSLRAVSQVFQAGKLDDQGVILEYQLPLTSKRLDCLVCGRDASGSDRAVIIELKQWDRCGASDGEDLVSTWIGGAERDVLHPSAQVRQYQYYLQDNHTAFHEGPVPVQVSSCAYLHNYYPVENDVRFSPPFAGLLEHFPTYTADHVGPLTGYLAEQLSGGEGLPVLTRIEESRYRPSKKLMEHVAGVIKGKKEYILLDEQLVVFQKILACAAGGVGGRQKTAVIVQGGPGTGKSVIALNVMSELLLKHHNAQYATGSRAFTTTLREIIGTRGSIQFKYFNGYGAAQPNEIDVLISDEAHRLRRTSDSQYTPKAKRGSGPQVDELLSAAKVSVFFVDDRQVVRPNEIGSSGYIKEHAQAKGCRVLEYELETQFRCAGSDAFVSWIGNTLAIERTASILWEGDENFEFRIVDSPQNLEKTIREKAAAGFSARMTAGFCWPWSLPASDGKLVDDVKIDGFSRPWNAKPEAKKLAKGIPKAELWAYDPNGIDQVGCIYTAQGFEFDYVGVIFGNDLVYSYESQSWEGHPENSKDRTVKQGKSQFLDLVKNVYRVLLSRGLKGCYVYFMDKSTEQFFRSRIEEGDRKTTAVAEVAAPILPPIEVELPSTAEPFRRMTAAEADPFVNCVPLYDLALAAGVFRSQTVNEVPQNNEQIRLEDYEWVGLPDEFRPRTGLFVARVAGESMNRRIPNGSWCLFRLAPQGTRQGKVVLAEHRSIEDPDTGGHFTVKIYESEKTGDADGGWSHSAIRLRPDSTDPGFKPIVLASEDADQLRIVAELVAVLG